MGFVARIGFIAVFSLTASLGASGVAFAQSTGDAGAAADASTPAAGERVDEATIRAPPPMSAASDATVRQRDLELRPRTRPADLFEVAPGMLVVQHAGGGKANQYFLRGFDADHGTDVALSVDGVPFNNVSHGHGQGYADPHFIIPELVERVDVHEGPYRAADGDFATAGAIDLQYLRSVPDTTLSLEGGMYGHRRLLGVVRTEGAGLRGYLAAELAHDDGPFVHPLAYDRFNLVGRWTYAPSGRTRFTLTLMSYGGAWNASGQVPSRLADDPSSGFSRFDAVDPHEGGQSTRYSAHAQLAHRIDDTSSFEATAWVLRYQFDLFSNFTFFADDPARGDMIEQTDARTTAGLRAAYRRTDTLGSWRFVSAVGAQARADVIENGLHHAPARERVDTVNLSGVTESSVGLYAEEQVVPARWIRLVLGARADLFDFNVEDRRAGLSMPDPNASGSRQAGIASPKATLVISPARWLDLYANFGSGFHSNDARGVVRRDGAVTPLARGLGYEVGARVRVGGRLDAAVSAWGLDLDSELVWVGDDGTTDARGPSRRLGLTGEVRWSILPWLRADVDVSLVNATYVGNAGNGDAVALAPTLVASAGLSARHPSGFYGSVRMRAVGDRPADPGRDLTAEGFAIFNAQVGYRRGWWELALQAENLFDSTWREAQFEQDSRLRGECLTPGLPRCNPPAGGQRYGTVTDMHFTPGTPFSALARFTVHVR